MGGSTTLNESHLTGQYSYWVTRSSKGPKFARCRLCSKDINIETMGGRALSSHAEGAKHQNLEAAAKSTRPIRARPPMGNSASGQTETISTGASSSSNKNAGAVSVETFITSGITLESKVRKAETMWVIHTVYNNNSFTGNNAIGYVLRQMFTDSNIASKFKFAETKTNYVLEHGIARHFRELLKGQVANNPVTKWFVVCFDETLNGNLQEKQLDLNIRL